MLVTEVVFPPRPIPRCLLLMPVKSEGILAEDLEKREQASG